MWSGIGSGRCSRRVQWETNKGNDWFLGIEMREMSLRGAKKWGGKERMIDMIIDKVQCFDIYQFRFINKNLKEIYLSIHYGFQ